MQDFEHIVEMVQKHPKLVAVDDYELCIRKTDETECEYLNGNPSQETTKDRLWIGLRLIHRKQPGKSAVSLVSKDSIQWLVDSAYACADRAPVDPWFRFPLWKAHGPESREVESVEDAPEFLESVYPKLSKRPNFLRESFSKTEEKMLLVRKTERNRLFDKRRVYGLETSLAFSGEVGDALTDQREFGTEPLVRKKESYIDSLGMGFAISGAIPYREKVKGPIIIGPRVMVYLLSLLKEWFYADLLQRGESPFTGYEKGNLLFSKAITLIDDGTKHNRVFDLEGTLTQKTVLIERGVLKDFLFDTYSATRENRLSTGNLLSKGMHDFPQIGSHHFYIENGEEGDLVRELGNGITIDSIEEVRAKRDNRVLLIGRGWRVENGTLTGALSQIPLEINLLDILSNATRAGDDLQFFRKIGSPSILFEKIPLNR